MIIDFLNQEREKCLSLEIQSYAEVTNLKEDYKMFIFESIYTKNEELDLSSYSYACIKIKEEIKEFLLKDFSISVKKEYFPSFGNNPDLIITLKR